MLKKLTFILIILFTTTLPCFSLSLDEAVNYSLKHNYKIKSTKLNRESFLHKYKAVKALQMPSFYLNSSYTELNNEKNINFSTPLGKQNIKITEQNYIDFSTGIKLNIYTGGFISGSINKAKYEEKIVENQLEETKLDIIYNTKIAYINILELLAYKKIAENHLKALKRHIFDIKSLYKEGIVPYIDVLQTDVKVKEAIQKLTSINNSIKVAKTNLSIIMGAGPYDNISVKNLRKNFIKKLNIDTLYNLAKNNRPVLKIFANKIKAADSAIDIASSGYKPKLYIAGGYNYSDMQENIDDKGSFLLQMGVKFNLDWSKSFEEVNAAKKSKQSAIYAQKDILLKTLLGVKKAFEEYSTAISNLKVALSSVKSAKEYFRTVKLKYKEGLANNTDVLDGEAMLTKALMQAKMYYFNIMKKYFLLERVIGKEFEK